MSAGISYPAPLARQVAEHFVAAIAEACERVEIVGSLRRGCARVHAIDVLVISKSAPSLGAQSSLFKTVEQIPAVWLRLNTLAEQGKLRGVNNCKKYCKCIAAKSGIPIDVYLASAQTWPTLQLIRTGSAKHNIKLCVQAQRLGMTLHADGRGLQRGDEMLAVENEAQIFELLELDYLPPERRA